jgi:hypothetical protein
MCSEECVLVRRRSQWKEWSVKNPKERKDYGTAPCANCGTTISKIRESHVYCSKRCMVKANPRPPAERKCAYCGVDVYYRNGKAVCSGCRKDVAMRQSKVYNRRTVLKRYGLNEADFNRLLNNQGGVCAVCRTDNPPGKGWCVDHCHDTGVVRGVLCTNCNTGIGQLGDDVERLLAAVEYLKKPRQLRFAA